MKILLFLLLLFAGAPLAAEELPQCSCADKIQIYTPDGKTWVLGPADEVSDEPDVPDVPDPPDPGASAGAKFIAETAKFRDPDSGRPIQLYHGVRINGGPSPESFGMVAIRTIPQRAFLPNSSTKQGSTDRTLPAAGVVESIVRDAPEIFVPDIEHWWPPAGNGTASFDASSISNYLSVGARINASKGSKVWGWYSAPPARSYYAPVRGGGLLADWKRTNDALKPMADQADILFPSIYTFSALRDRDDWKTYACGQVSEAKRLAPGKPVLPYLWPFYHSAGTEPIDGQFMRFQVDTVIGCGASGAVIWQTSTNNRTDYSHAKFPWVEAIRDYAQEELERVR